MGNFRLCLVLMSINCYLIGSLTAQCKIDYSNYNLFLNEEFYYADVSELCYSSIWTCTPSPCEYWGWGDSYNDQTQMWEYGEYYSPQQLSFPVPGILRLTATKQIPPPSLVCLDQTRYPNYRSGMIRTFGTLPETWKYGMYEIKCKLPKEGCFPSFWLLGNQGACEIFEYGGQYEGHIFSTTIHNDNNDPPVCANYYKKSSWDSLYNDFHTWTGVWTPDKFTIFFDGRELQTLSASFFPMVNGYFELVLNLATRGWNLSPEIKLDVDYIRVYKPKNDDYTLSYKSTAEYLHHNVFDGITVDSKVSDKHGSIAVNKNNKNQLFYRGLDDRIYEVNAANGLWTSSVIPYNYDPPILPALLVQGDLVYNPVFNYILYKGQDHRIQFFNKYNNAWWHWFIDDDFSSSSRLISSTPGSMDVININGTIVYKGQNGKIHLFEYDESSFDYVHRQITYTYGTHLTSDFVKGDVVVDQNNKWIFYKGQDDRLQCFVPGSNNSYVHYWVDLPNNPSSNKVSSTPGSIIMTGDNEIYYKGVDNKMHKYLISGTTFTHTLIDYTYGACAGFADADYIRGNLAFNPSNNKIYYTGFDGRIQFFQKYLGGANVHWWTDDYFNTWDFLSYNVFAPSASVSSLSCQLLDGKLLYTQNDGNLAYFQWEPCEVLNPGCDVSSSQAIVFGMQNPDNEVNENHETLKRDFYEAVYPNPFEDEIYIDLSSSIDSKLYSVTIYDISGRIVYQADFDHKKIDINTSDYSPGIYFLYFKSGKNVVKHNLIKMY